MRGHACSNCGSEVAIEVAHVRIGSGAGMGQKPDDWHTVSLCHECHALQHQIGEIEFWNRWVEKTDGDLGGPFDLIDAFCKISPKSAEIARIRKDREGG